MIKFHVATYRKQKQHAHRIHLWIFLKYNYGRKGEQPITHQTGLLEEYER